MIKVLRVSTHPTNLHKSVGYQSQMVSINDNLETIFVAPIVTLGDDYINHENYTLVRSDVYFPKKPENPSLVKSVIFSITRILKIFHLSYISIKQGYINNVDVVHIHSPMYFFVAVWAKLTSRKSCITYHGTDYLIIKDSKIYKFFSNKFLDVGFCISPIMVNKMKEFHTKVCYSPNGINTKEFIDMNIKRKKIILAVGSLKKEKSFDNLIEAFSRIHKLLPDYKLLIAGDGHLKPFLYEMCVELNITNKVLFLGNLEKKLLIQQYNESEVFILSSKSEGFPKVILEALFCGCKVVSTNVGSVNELLPEKYIIRDNSIDLLAEGMFKIVSNKEYYVDKSSLESKYTWNNTRKIYENIYKSIV